MQFSHIGIPFAAPAGVSHGNNCGWKTKTQNAECGYVQVCAEKRGSHTQTQDHLMGPIATWKLCPVRVARRRFDESCAPAAI